MIRLLSRASLPLAIALPGLAGLASARAAELIMFERAGCSYCEPFDREIAPIYPRSPIGRQAPLPRVDFYQSIPRARKLASRVRP